jgi:hypothetical protein
MGLSSIIRNIWSYLFALIAAAGYTIGIFYKSDVLLWSTTALLIFVLCCIRRFSTTGQGQGPAPVPYTQMNPVLVPGMDTSTSIIIIQNPQNNLSIGYLQERTIKLNNPMRPSVETTIRDDPN